MIVFSGKVIILGQSSSIRAKGGCKSAKWLYSGKMVVFAQKWL